MRFIKYGTLNVPSRQSRIKRLNEIINLFSVSAGVEWPPGSYALPKSIYGCPAPSINNWHNGYMNISFKESIALLESYIGRLGWNEVDLNVIELLGPYGSHSIQLNFCSKRENGSFEWPPSGQYGVYGTEDGCPQGITRLFAYC